MDSNRTGLASRSSPSRLSARPWALALSTLVILAAACGSSTEPPERPFTLGVLPDEVPERLVRKYSGLSTRLEATLDREVELIIPDDYEDLVTRFARGEVDLDAPIADLAYPVGTETDLAITKVGEPIEAINKVALTLTDAERSGDEIQFTWRTENPTKYQAYVHIGNPSVIGSDGIIYGRYRAPHLVDTPITLANDSAEWTTSVAVPADVQGLFALPSVESKQQKNYVSHAIDLTQD